MAVELEIDPRTAPRQEWNPRFSPRKTGLKLELNQRVVTRQLLRLCESNEQRAEEQLYEAVLRQWSMTTVKRQPPGSHFDSRE